MFFVANSVKLNLGVKKSLKSVFAPFAEIHLFVVNYLHKSFVRLRAKIYGSESGTTSVHLVMMRILQKSNESKFVLCVGARLGLVINIIVSEEFIEVQNAQKLELRRPAIQMEIVYREQIRFHKGSPTKYVNT